MSIKKVAMFAGGYFVAAWLYNEFAPDSWPTAPLDLIAKVFPDATLGK